LSSVTPVLPVSLLHLGDIFAEVTRGHMVERTLRHATMKSAQCRYRRVDHF